MKTVDVMQLYIDDIKRLNAYEIVSDIIMEQMDGDEDDVVVDMAISYDGRDYMHVHEFGILYYDSIEWVKDWWEGQKYIRIYGYIRRSQIDYFNSLEDKRTHQRGVICDD